MKLRPVILAAVLAVSGCTESAPSDTQVATAAQPSATAGASQSQSPAPETDYDKALRFTRCMNALGEKIPDPVEGKPIQTSTVNAGGWSASSPNFPKCKQYLPATWPVKVDPKTIARERRFGECMRKHGMPWYEPDADGLVHYPTDPDYTQAPEYRAAEDACRYLYDDAADNQ